MAFHDLVRDGSLARVRAAIAKGTQIDRIDSDGFTPLMVACSAGHAEIARLLIEHGAELKVTGPKGETALSLAMVNCASIAYLLVERGALGRPLRTPEPGTLLSPGECDVCTRYPDRIDPDDRWSSSPAWLAWLETVTEERSTEDKADYVYRSLRCPFCGTCYDQSYVFEIETVGVTLPYVSESIVRLPRKPAVLVEERKIALPTDLPRSLLGARFESEDGKLACQIDRGSDKAPFRTTVWARAGGGVLLSAAHTTWHPATRAGSEHASERLGQMQAELGIIGAGNLYDLYVVRENPDKAIFGTFDWIAALPDTPLEELRLFPQHSTSPYMPDDWDWQEGWWYPYSTFHPAKGQG